MIELDEPFRWYFELIKNSFVYKNKSFFKFEKIPIFFISFIYSVCSLIVGLFIIGISHTDKGFAFVLLISFFNFLIISNGSLIEKSGDELILNFGANLGENKSFKSLLHLINTISIIRLFFLLAVYLPMIISIPWIGFKLDFLIIITFAATYFFQESTKLISLINNIKRDRFLFLILKIIFLLFIETLIFLKRNQIKEKICLLSFNSIKKITALLTILIENFSSNYQLLILLFLFLVFFLSFLTYLFSKKYVLSLYIKKHCRIKNNVAFRIEKIVGILEFIITGQAIFIIQSFFNADSFIEIFVLCFVLYLSMIKYPAINFLQKIYSRQPSPMTLFIFTFNFLPFLFPLILFTTRKIDIIFYSIFLTPFITIVFFKVLAFFRKNFVLPFLKEKIIVISVSTMTINLITYLTGVISSKIF
ncbi:hypothetical protein FCS83_05855 [Oenococcus sp. UCMA 17063]|nr:hypothetical protein [Oenococcus sp. UCMA 17063]